MRRIVFTVTSLVFIFSYTHAPAQEWSGIIAPGRAIDWSNAGVTGGLPARTTICSTLGTQGQSARFSQPVTAAQIKSAISSCPSGQTVFLNAGTYNLSDDGVVFSNVNNVTLRGAGADQTHLIFSNHNSCGGLGAAVCMEGDNSYWGGPENIASVSGTLTKGSTVLTFSSAANLRVGNPVVIDQLDDTADGGFLYVCQDHTLSCIESSGVPTGFQRPSRGQQQMVTVAACSPSCPNSGPTTVTISSGLYMPNYSSARSPQAWWSSSPIHGDGLENLSIDGTNAGASYNVQMLNCQGCYVKGIASVVAANAHIAYLVSNQGTVRDSYFWGNASYGSDAYGLTVGTGSDLLWENNIFQHIPAPILYDSDCEGCVTGYNFSINDYYSNSSNWLSQMIFHHSTVMMSLAEGNVGGGIYSDSFHGTSFLNTAFRNRFDGYELNNGAVTSSQTNPFSINAFHRMFNLVGNVLGSTGRPHTHYQCTSTAQCGGAGEPNQYQSIYVLGTSSTTTVADDANVLSTTLRWGNYDVVNGSAQFNSAEVPSATAQFSNPVPPSHNLPASFYYGAKPTWWPAAKAWPAIGPDVTGGNLPGVGGFAFTNPAQDCYLTYMGGPASGSGGQLSFNSSTCYGSSAGSQNGSPAPPSGLSAVIN